MTTATVVVNKTTGKFVGRFKHASGALKVADKSKALIAAGSASDLDMSASNLVKLHNSVADKPVKKFVNLKTAQSKTFKALLARKAQAEIKKNAKTVTMGADDNRKIHTTKAAEGKSWQEGSVRGKCFDLITEGMTVKFLLHLKSKLCKML